MVRRDPEHLFVGRARAVQVALADTRLGDRDARIQVIGRKLQGPPGILFRLGELLQLDVGLAPEQKNVTAAQSPKRKQPEQEVGQGIWRIAGVLVLLVGLVLLFSIMLKARSLRRMERRGTVGFWHERRHRD